jgi:16S rRNA (cytosine967-C5)-methyltransferase
LLLIVTQRSYFVLSEARNLICIKRFLVSVLDACVAPDGKMLHLLECCKIDTLIALDNQSTRVSKLTNTLQRLNLSAKICCADATKPETWRDNQLFDRILLDVPCSGSGVIRRHPDIKYLRQPSDIQKLALEQARLLSALWALARTGRKITLYNLFSVCRRK